mgnify:CR=1 FL=1
MKRNKNRKKPKLSPGMLESLKRSFTQIYPPVRDHQTERLTKRGYLSNGYTTEKADKILRQFYQ